MKKEYIAPEAEVIEFDYRDQVVASGDSCTKTHSVVNGYVEAWWYGDNTDRNH